MFLPLGFGALYEKAARLKGDGTSDLQKQRHSSGGAKSSHAGEEVGEMKAECRGLARFVQPFRAPLKEIAGGLKLRGKSGG